MSDIILPTFCEKHMAVQDRLHRMYDWSTIGNLAYATVPPSPNSAHHFHCRHHLCLNPMCIAIIVRAVNVGVVNIIVGGIVVLHFDR